MSEVRRGRGRVWFDKANDRRIFWYDLTGRQRQATLSTPQAARRRAVEIAELLDRGEDWRARSVRPRVDLAELSRAYLTWLSEEGAAARTVVGYGGMLQRWLDWLDASGHGHTAAALSRDMLQGWYDAPRMRVLSPARRRMVMQRVEALWRWAYDTDRWHDVPPPRRLHLRGKRKAPDVQVPSWWQVDRMLEQLLGDDRFLARRPRPGVAPDYCRRVGLLVRYTGLRRTAACLLAPRDVDRVQWQIRVPGEITKRGTGGRVIPVHAALRPHVDAWVEEGAATLVRAPDRNGQGGGQVGGEIAQAWAQAGMDRRLWDRRALHCIRGTLHTSALLHGVDLYTARAMLGHSERTTSEQHYTDRQALTPIFRQAWATVPAIGEATEEDPWNERTKSK